MPGAVRTSKPSDHSRPKLWSATICPYATRVRIGFHLKGVDIDRVDIDLGNKPKEFLDITPKGLVPVIEDRGHVIYESLICLEYIDEEWKSASGVCLLPQDPVKRAFERVWCDRVSEKIVACFAPIIGGKNREEANKVLVKLLDGIQDFSKQLEKMEEGPFFGGKNLSLVDIILIPFALRFNVLNHYLGFEIPKTKEYAKFHAWWKAVTEHPSYIETNTEFPILLKAASRTLGHYLEEK